MKEFNDEDIERLLSGALGKTRDGGLDPGFAGRVTQRIERIQAKKERRSNLLFYVLIGVLAAACITGAYMLEDTSRLAPVLLPYKWPFLFGILLIFIIQRLDHGDIKQYLESRQGQA